ncbi:MAG: G5 domain-containing protein [Eubacteriales bacterium]
MTDSINSKPNKAADTDEFRKVYIQHASHKKQRDKTACDTQSGSPAKVSGISRDIVVYVDAAIQPVKPEQSHIAPDILHPVPQSDASHRTQPLPEPVKTVTSTPSTVSGAKTKRRSVMDTEVSYYPRMLTQKQRKAAKRASAIKGIAAGVFSLGVCAVLVISGAAEGILFPYTSTLEAQQLGHDSYNTAFEFITYEFPVEISMGDKVSYTLMSSGSTVKEVLEDAGIVLGELDSTSLPLDHVVSDNDEIEVEKVEVKTRTAERYVQYATKTVDSQTVPKGKTKVVKKGQNGVITDTYECRYINGELAEETLISSATTSQPVDEVINRGIGGVFTAPNGKKYKYSYYVDVSATAYGDVSEGTDPSWHGITAIGEKVRPGIIGVDPKVIPFRSNVYVIGDYGDFGVCYAADCGDATGNILDIYMETYAQMVKFGRRDMRAYVLE